MILSVISETAPRPLSRFQHQATLDRILMHVAQLFDLLAPRPHVEVIEAGLPDVSPRVLVFPPQGWLRLAFPLAQDWQHTPGEALLDHLQDGRGSTLLWLPDQNVEVFRHHHVTDHDKIVALTGLL